MNPAAHIICPPGTRTMHGHGLRLGGVRHWTTGSYDVRCGFHEWLHDPDACFRRRLRADLLAEA